MKRSIQIEQEEINETEIQDGLEEITGQNDPLNLVFNYFDTRFKEIQNQIRNNNDKESAEKNEKSKLKLLNKNVTGCNTNLTQT